MEEVKELLFTVIKRVILYVLFIGPILFFFSKEAAFGFAVGAATSIINFWLLSRSIKGLSPHFLLTKTILGFFLRMLICALSLYVCLKRGGLLGFFSCFAGLLMVKFILFERYILWKRY